MDTKYKCPRCKNDKEFKVVELCRHTYEGELTEDDWGGETYLEQLSCVVYCLKCGKPIDKKKRFEISLWELLNKELLVLADYIKPSDWEHYCFQLEDLDRDGSVTVRMD